MAQSEWTSIFQREANELTHGHIWGLEFDYSIEPNSPEPGWKEYIRNTSARFQCSQCQRTWPSNRVMVLFHMCLMDGKGVVKVRPFRQNCKMCPEAPMEDPTIDPDNITKLMTNLVKKIRIKCYNEVLDEGGYNFQWIDVNNPHEPSHCEGCIRGVCTRQ